MFSQPGAAQPGPAGHPGQVDASGRLSGDGSEIQTFGLALGDGSSTPEDGLIAIEDVQKALNRSRASVYRYTNTDPRNLNPPFNPRKLNPEYRTDQKEPLQFHPNEVARFARDVLRIKEVTVEVLNSPSSATQHLLSSILEELRAIRSRLDAIDAAPTNLGSPRHLHNQSRPAA